MANRTQALVLIFFVVALGSLLVILVAAPEVYDQALRLRSGSTWPCWPVTDAPVSGAPSELGLGPRTQACRHLGPRLEVGARIARPLNCEYA